MSAEPSGRESSRTPCKDGLIRLLPKFEYFSQDWPHYVIFIEYSVENQRGALPSLAVTSTADRAPLTGTSRCVAYDEDYLSLCDAARVEHPDAQVILRPRFDILSPSRKAEQYRELSLAQRDAEIDGESFLAGPRV